MCLNSSLLLVIRSIGAAFLMLVNTQYLFSYVAGDMSIYLLIKIVRQDFVYWFPLNGWFGLVVSFLLRVIFKFIADFTGVVHFRHPHDLGGLYYSVNMVLAIVFAFVTAFIYKQSVTGSEKGELALLNLSFGNEAYIWGGLSGMGALWVLGSATFVLLMKPEFLHTFTSTLTGHEMARQIFQAGKSDYIKSGVLYYNYMLWLDIRPDVKKWIADNWWKWEVEKPKWFHDVFKSRVPLDMVPPEVIKEKKAAKLNELNSSKSSSKQIAVVMAGVRRMSSKELKTPALISDIITDSNKSPATSSMKKLLGVYAGEGRRKAAGIKPRPSHGGMATLKKQMSVKRTDNKGAKLNGLQPAVQRAQLGKQMSVKVRRLSVKQATMLGDSAKLQKLEFNPNGTIKKLQGVEGLLEAGKPSEEPMHGGGEVK
jgi:hypothetical protein